MACLYIEKIDLKFGSKFAKPWVKTKSAAVKKHAKAGFPIFAGLLAGLRALAWPRLIILASFGSAQKE
jgi:hypothetical protein